MSQDRPDVITRSVQETDIWLHELQSELGLASPAQAYSVLRPVLHALRDRLTVPSAAHLAAQMPAMLVGIYYDGWKPTATPKPIRDADSFLVDVMERAAGNDLGDVRRAVAAVFGQLDRKLSPGTFQKAAEELPQDVRELQAA